MIIFTTLKYIKEWFPLLKNNTEYLIASPTRTNPNSLIIQLISSFNHLQFAKQSRNFQNPQKSLQNKIKFVGKKFYHHVVIIFCFENLIFGLYLELVEKGVNRHHNAKTGINRFFFFWLTFSKKFVCKAFPIFLSFFKVWYKHFLSKIHAKKSKVSKDGN